MRTDNLDPNFLGYAIGYCAPQSQHRTSIGTRAGYEQFRRAWPYPLQDRPGPVPADR